MVSFVAELAPRRLLAGRSATRKWEATDDLRVECSISVRVAQISLDGEVFSEAMQANGFYIGGVAHAGEIVAGLAMGDCIGTT